VQSKQSRVDDNFGTFLSTLNDDKKATRKGAVSGPNVGSDASSGASSSVSIDLTANAVRILSASEETTVAGFQAAMQLSLTEFYDLISTLDQLGLIGITGSPGSEVVTLTERGQLLANMS